MFNGRQHLCFHIIPRTFKCMLLHPLPAVNIYTSICLTTAKMCAFMLFCELSNLCFFMLCRQLLFTKHIFYPDVEIYACILFRELSILCFFMLCRPLIFMQTSFYWPSNCMLAYYSAIFKFHAFLLCRPLLFYASIFLPDVKVQALILILSCCFF